MFSQHPDHVPDYQTAALDSHSCPVLPPSPATVFLTSVVDFGPPNQPTVLDNPHANRTTAPAIPFLVHTEFLFVDHLVPPICCLRLISQCTVRRCNAVLGSALALSQHLDGHLTTRPFHCTFAGCRRKFKVASAMERHMRLHAGGMALASVHLSASLHEHC